MKIAIFSLKGLGDTLMQIPLIRALNRAHPGSGITVLVPDGACADIFKNCPYVRAVTIAYRQPGPELAAAVMKLLYFLRAEKFDASITAFPSNRVWYNLLAAWTGAPKRITHSYPRAALRTLSFLQNCRVAADPARHELENNLNLLSCLGLDPGAEKDLSPWLSPEDGQYAENFLAAHGLNDGSPVVGLHPAINPRQIYKAWGTGNAEVFAGLTDWLASAFGAKVILFSGPDEKEAAADTLRLTGTRPAVCEGATINQTAALIKKCRLFINTDSGLGHLAASVRTPAVTVFGPANPGMTSPYGAANKIIAPSAECAPCYDYPYGSTYPRLKCSAPECLKRIDLNALKETVSEAMKEPRP